MADKRKVRKILENRRVIIGLYVFISLACLSWLMVFSYRGRLVPVLSRGIQSTETAAGLSDRPAGEGGEGAFTDKSRPAASKMRSKVRGKIAVVIDDVGYNTPNLNLFLNFPGPLTISILPGLPGSSDARKLAAAAGKESILHLPMEAENGEDPGPGAVFVRMKEPEIRALVQKHIKSLPGIVGMNNHMGSRATRDERVMKIVLEEIKKKNLFFLDSGTVAGSVGKKTAGILNIPFLERSVFLDNERDKTAIREAIGRGKTLAEKHGHAVMIGHVWCSELADVLIDVYPELLDEGFGFYNLSELLKGEPADEDSWD